MQTGFANTDFEEPYLGWPRDGSVLLTAGAVAIILAAVPATFIYDGVRVGSDFCLIWALVQGGIGLLLVIVGAILEHLREEPEEHPALERWILSEETTP